LAVTAGLTTASVSRIEGGRNENPRLETLRALARVLGIEVAALLTHEKNDASK
jgi:transcriptional regulator with XRE-family HTH domain